MTSLGSIKTLLRAPVLPILWQSGALSVFHRVVHRQVLTVFGLHRVLAADDPRRPYAMPMWTVSATLFADLLEFIARHYNPVSADDVVAAAEGRGVLPPHASLLTFDDGWADTADTALPLMRRKGIPGVVFVVSGHVGSGHGFWDTEWYAALVSQPSGARRRVWRALGGQGPEPNDDAVLVDDVLRVLRRLPLAERWRALETHLGGPVSQGVPMMVDAAALRALVDGGVAIGGHGVTHEPLSSTRDGAEEITRCATDLAALVAAFQPRVRVFSFPHGRYDAALVAHAASLGFAAQFTSRTVLNPVPAAPSLPWMLGRVWADFTMEDDRGRLKSTEAAWMFFRSPPATVEREARPLALQDADD